MSSIYENTTLSTKFKINIKTQMLKYLQRFTFIDKSIKAFQKDNLFIAW